MNKEGNCIIASRFGGEIEKKKSKTESKRERKK